METFLIIFVIFLVGFVSGWEMRERAARKFVDRFLEENLGELEQEVKENSINIIIEKHGESFYVFQKEDSAFMAQGKDRQELESVLAKNFPGKRFYATPTNLKEVGFYK